MKPRIRPVPAGRAYYVHAGRHVATYATFREAADRLAADLRREYAIKRLQRIQYRLGWRYDRAAKCWRGPGGGV